MDIIYHPNDKKNSKGNFGKKNRDFTVDASWRKVQDEIHKEIEWGRALPHGQWLSMVAIVPEKECKPTAKKIRGLSDEQIFLIHKRVQDIMTVDVKALRGFSIEWAEFLETCGGFDSG